VKKLVAGLVMSDIRRFASERADISGRDTSIFSDFIYSKGRYIEPVLPTACDK
jgi:hypothetical protein